MIILDETGLEGKKLLISIKLRIQITLDYKYKKTYLCLLTQLQFTIFVLKFQKEKPLLFSQCETWHFFHIQQQLTFNKKCDKTSPLEKWLWSHQIIPRVAIHFPPKILPAVFQGLFYLHFFQAVPNASVNFQQRSMGT